MPGPPPSHRGRALGSHFPNPAAAAQTWSKHTSTSKATLSYGDRTARPHGSLAGKPARAKPRAKPRAAELCGSRAAAAAAQPRRPIQIGLKLAYMFPNKPSSPLEQERLVTLFDGTKGPRPGSQQVPKEACRQCGPPRRWSASAAAGWSQSRLLRKPGAARRRDRGCTARFPPSPRACAIGARVYGRSGSRTLARAPATRRALPTGRAKTDALRRSPRCRAVTSPDFLEKLLGAQRLQVLDRWAGARARPRSAGGAPVPAHGTATAPPARRPQERERPVRAVQRPGERRGEAPLLGGERGGRRGMPSGPARAAHLRPTATASAVRTLRAGAGETVAGRRAA